MYSSVWIVKCSGSRRNSTTVGWTASQNSEIMLRCFTYSSQKSPPPISKPAPRLPRDRYVAPEMADWTKVFRFGHSILVLTNVNDSKPMLFGLDTGAFANILSVRAGRQVGKVSSDDTLRV